MSDRKRTMIILWKWEELIDSETLHDEVKIHKSKRDKIIRVCKKKGEGGRSLVSNLGKEVVENSDVFIFLHRGDGFNQEDVKSTLCGIKNTNTKKHLLKCFLFGEGRDFIYYKTQSEGLLGQVGYFFEQRKYPIYKKDDCGKIKLDVNGKKIIDRKEHVAIKEYIDNEEIEYEIKVSHFDRVWNYYKNEFVKKVSELMIDFNSAFVEIGDPEQNKNGYNYSEWSSKIDNNEYSKKKFLKIRMMSFLDLFDDGVLLHPNVESEEMVAFKKFEKDEETDYIFDDCTANFSQYGDSVNKKYNELKKLWLPTFNNIGNDNKFSLSYANDLLNRLLESLNAKK